MSSLTSRRHSVDRGEYLVAFLAMEDKYSDPDVSGLLNVACFLDPRYITEYISTAVWKLLL